MTNIVKKKLPHGDIPFTKITDVEVRQKVMMLNENINSLKSQLEAVQSAITELQRKV